MGNLVLFFFLNTNEYRVYGWFMGKLTGTEIELL
jgi:hypothetical protein